MPQLILILLALVIIALLLSHKTREVAVGICQTTLHQTVRKNTNKDKALEFIKSQGEAGNEEIRANLGVSDRSVTRYMEELEKEGKVEQVGATGRSVAYRLKL